MNGNANGGETPSGQRSNVLVYRLLWQQIILKNVQIHQNVHQNVQIQNRNVAYLIYIGLKFQYKYEMNPLGTTEI